MSTQGLFMSIYGRNQHGIVDQLLKINKLKKMTNHPSRRVLDGFKRYFLRIVLMIVFNFRRLKMQILRV